MSTPASKSRREVLEGIVAAQPGDAFARYGLALECANSGDTHAALAHFRQLLAAHPGYVAGHQQYGQLLARMGLHEDARRAFREGIAAAQQSGNAHAAAEMEEALHSLGV